MSRWQEQFRWAEISTLRSPVVHHPSPDPYALTDFIEATGLERSGLPYDLPTTDAFARFCEALVDHHQLSAPLSCTPQTISSDGGRVEILCRDVYISARELVVATNPHRRVIPDWIWPLLGQHPGLVTHGADLDLGEAHGLVDQRVAIIGGGMTAAHLALGAASRGADVELISRRALNIRSFDTPPGWLGPKNLAAFDAVADPRERLRQSQQARDGGSIPDWLHRRLTQFHGAGSIQLRESANVQNAIARPDGRCDITLDAETLCVDKIWLATGTRADASALRCLRPLLEDTITLDGHPVLTDSLRLGPHPVYVMGRLATVTLGPAAGNLWGAQRAALRITEAITGVDLACHHFTPVRARALRD